MTQALVPLTQSDRLRVRQVKEWTEVLLNWETKNRYAVVDDQERQLLFAGETGGIAHFFISQWLGRKRPFTIELKDGRGQPVLRVERPFTFFFSRCELFDGAGNKLGRVQQRFKLLGRRFDLEDASGNTVAVAHGPLFSPWTFNVEQGGAEVAQIKKRWSGVLTELFTDADNFAVSFRPGLDPLLRALIVGATFLVDFVYFERGRRKEHHHHAQSSS